MTVEEVYAKYGDWVSPIEAHEIIKAAKEKAFCEKCQGLPCLKSTNKQCRQVVKVDAEKHTVTVGFLTTCEYVMRARRKSRFRKCKIPKVYEGKTFEDYEVTPQNKAAVEWAKWAIRNPQEGILFYGIPGVGKTFLVAIIAQELVSQGKSLIFGDVPSLLDELKATFNRKQAAGDVYQPSIDELMTELARVEVLVLDDIGTEYSTAWALERLYMIINNRCNEGKPIIATSNFNAETLAARFKDNVMGKRIVSRLCEVCKAVELKGYDRRLRR